MIIFPVVGSLFSLLPASSVLLQTPLSSPSSVPAKTQIPLSLSEAIARAQKENPTPQAALARLHAAEALAAGASRPPNPTVALAKPYGSINTGGFGEDVIVGQTLEWGDKVRYRSQAAQAVRDAAQADQTATTSDLTLSVQSAYYEALRADAEMEQATRLLATTRQFADAAQVQFDAGDAARSNVVRSQIEVSRAEQTLLIAQTDRDNRYATLRSLLNIPELAALVLTDPLVFAPKSFELSALIQWANSNRPDILAARKLRDARHADMRGAKTQALPDLTIEGRRATFLGGDTDQQPGSSVRFSIAFPIFDYGKIRSDIRNAQANQNEQEALLRETERVARLEVETTFREQVQAASLVDSFEKGRLARSQELVTMVQIGYANGGNSYLEVIDAQRVYQAEQVEYARAVAAVNIATARLQRAVGGKLP